MSHRAKLLAVLAVVAVAAIIGAILPFALDNTARQRDAERSLSSVERSGIELGGPFTLTDHNGRRVNEATYEGKVRLTFFGFTSCPDICPTTLSTIGGVLDELGENAADVVPILITVDPERDTAPVLRDYVAAFHPNTVALTGSLEEIAAVAKSYAVSFNKVPLEGGGYTMDHSASTLLIDRAGRFRSTLDRHEPLSIWEEKIKRALAAPSPGGSG